MVGIKDNEGYTNYIIEHQENYDGYGGSLADIRRRIGNAVLLVGFNIKFDLNWLRRYLNDIVYPPVFDCQLAHFILSNQADSWPSLNGVSYALGLGSKRDTVELEYWDRGIDTDQIPLEVLSDYLRCDIELTEQVFERQRELLEGKKKRLFWLQCEDLLILEEMEFNGLKYNVEEAQKRSAEAGEQHGEFTRRLNSLVPLACVDWNSSDHISCVLYGGQIPVDVRIPTERILKDGTIKKGEKWGVEYITFPQLVRPPKNSEVKPTAGMVDDEVAAANVQRILDCKRLLIRHYSVAEPVLKRVNTSKSKVARDVITNLLGRARLQKLDSTYYGGLLKKMEEMEWMDDGMLHGQFNQCVVVTGRLSSSKPNLQNFSGEIKELFPTRFTE